MILKYDPILFLHKAGASFGLGLRRHSTLFTSCSQAHRIPRRPLSSSHIPSLRAASGPGLASPLYLSSVRFKLEFGIRTMSSFPSTIKAIGCPQNGDVDVIELLELPFPQQKPGEVLIKVLFS